MQMYEEQFTTAAREEWPSIVGERTHLFYLILPRAQGAGHPACKVVGEGGERVGLPREDNMVACLCFHLTPQPTATGHTTGLQSLRRPCRTVFPP